nr:class A beta-lactamase [Tateyamaria pelophila]
MVITALTSAHAETILEAIGGIERDLVARVGFYMHDMQTGEIITYAGADRFPLNSTFKVLACGALLAKADAGETNLDATVPLQDFEIVSYSPAVEAYIGAGHQEISFDEACRMALSVSDNTAANIVLSEIGGPDGLTTFLRSIGDQVTRLDRWETALNEARPGDPRDTTTPQAMARSLEKLILGDALSATSRSTLRDWLSAHSVADDLFRAALPPGWSIDDRTGAGGYGSRSIVAVLYPPGREPITVALFITETDASFSHRNAAVFRVGAAIVAKVGNE